MRSEFSRKTKALAFTRAGGHCEDCGVKITAANPCEYDHVVPAAEGGDNSLGNCSVRCKKVCHALKTKQDVKDIARIRRCRDKNSGAARKKSRFATSRDGAWKAKIGGGVVRR